MRISEERLSNCPICRADVQIEQFLFGDISCPGCGRGLWFVRLREGPVLWDRQATESLRDAVRWYLSERLGVPLEELSVHAGVLDGCPADSTEFIEFVMTIEGSGFDIPDEDYGKLRSIADVIRFISGRQE